MAVKNEKNENSSKSISESALFDKRNYLLMGIGLVLLALGFFLMAGGKSSDPKAFHPEEVYSATRITIAPILIILGFGIEIAAIMLKPKN